MAQSLFGKTYNSIIKKTREIKFHVDSKVKTESDYQIAHEQAKYYIGSKHYLIMTYIMTSLRQVHKLRLDKSISPETIRYNSKYLLDTYSINIDDYIATQNYDELFGILIDILRKELLSFVMSVYDDNDIGEKIVAEMFSNMLACDDCYKWGTHVRNLLDDCDKKLGFV